MGPISASTFRQLPAGLWEDEVISLAVEWAVGGPGLAFETWVVASVEEEAVP